MPFETNVFINCPFDDDFRTLLRPLIFTLIYLNFEPKVSQTNSSATIRINQIKEYIRESKFSIHDLSRSKPMKKTDLPRFNMPYELGLDIGCAEYGKKKYQEKRILIFDTNRYHLQKVLSDIVGQDIENHDDNPATLIRKVRNWFSAIDETKNYPSPNAIWVAYNQFYDDTTKTLSDEGFTNHEILNLTNSDVIKFAKVWIRDFKS